MRKAINQSLTFTSRVLFLILILTISSSAYAGDISGARFNENYIDQGVPMSLQGTGLKSFLFIKAFAAGFYKGKTNEADILGNYPKRIEVEYFVNIPGKKLNNYTVERMKDNVSKADLEALKYEIIKMGRYFVDLKPGDRFSLTYLPDIGTKFAHNGTLVGIIKGKDFAKALFSVWIGKRPFDKHLKEQVLGRTYE